jgi:uncharacterized protein RhaS with RHS repeats
MTDSHDNRFRTYDPATGRYISADPIGQLGEGGPNLYEYALGNPLSIFDSTGESPTGERGRTGPGGHRVNPGKAKPSYYPGRGGWGVRDSDSGKFKPLVPQPPPPTPDNPEPWRDHPDYKQDPPAPPDSSSQNQFSNFCAENPNVCAAAATAAVTAATVGAGCAAVLAALFGFGS